MELPILYALSYPDRVEDEVLRTYDPVRSPPLTFEEIDQEAFPLFGLGVEAGAKGGAAPAAYNAGNEIAEQRFPEMVDVVSEAIDGVGVGQLTSVEDVLAVDGTARAVATEVAHRLGEVRMGTTL